MSLKQEIVDNLDDMYLALEEHWWVLNPDGLLSNLVAISPINCHLPAMR